MQARPSLRFGLLIASFAMFAACAEPAQRGFTASPPPDQSRTGAGNNDGNPTRTQQQGTLEGPNYPIPGEGGQTSMGASGGQNSTPDLSGLFGKILDGISNGGSGNDGGTTTTQGTTDWNTNPGTTTTTGNQNQQPGSGGDACSYAVNQNISLGYPARMRSGVRGYISFSMLAPMVNAPRVGSPLAVFSNMPTPDPEAPGSTAGIYYQSGMVRNGAKVLGTLHLAYEGSELVAKVDLGSADIRVGHVVETTQSTGYPRLATIQFDSGACITQYLTSSGELFSGGTGYIVIP